jgi:hypothetical protein
LEARKTTQASANIKTRRAFRDYQLHLEWKIPENIPEKWFPARGNPAYVTVFFTGLLVQNHFELEGETLYIGQPSYKKPDSAPIKLPAHGEPSEPNQLPEDMGQGARSAHWFMDLVTR